MWVLDRQRLQSELRRQGLTLEVLVARAEIEREQVEVLVGSLADRLDQSVIARLAAALGVQPIDISRAALPTTERGLEARAADERAAPEEGG
ncbi:MAG: hypothetical protein HY876_00130 [Coriobacteriales bacterium]|nr:hypothetical protein [Coriobacteriales bacterium]